MTLLLCSAQPLDLFLNGLGGVASYIAMMSPVLGSAFPSSAPFTLTFKVAGCGFIQLIANEAILSNYLKGCMRLDGFFPLKRDKIP